MQYNVIITDAGYQDLNPLLFGHETCDPLHAVGPAVRSYYLLHFVVSGYGTFRTNGKEYTVGPGEIFVIHPFDETYYQADSENPWHYIWVGFSAKNGIPTELDDIVRCPEALNLFNTMKNCQKLENGRSAFLSARVWDLFTMFLDKENVGPDYIDKAIDCMHAEYMNDLTVGQIAERLNLDRSYFSTLFKKKVGISPKQYLIRYRMNIAASLLLNTQKSVSVIACSVGYSDTFNFSKMFKSHLGLSPSQFIQKKGKMGKTQFLPIVPVEIGNQRKKPSANGQQGAKNAKPN